MVIIEYLTAVNLILFTIKKKFEKINLPRQLGLALIINNNY